MKTRLFGLASYPRVVMRNLVHHYATVLLAGTISIAGVTGSRANQTVTLHNGYSFIACQVDGVGGNNINNAAFLQVPPTLSDPNGLNNAVLYVPTCSGFAFYQYFTDADAMNYFGISFGNGWYDPLGFLANNVIWSPGRGMIILKPTAGNETIIMNGTPHVPALPAPLPCGCGSLNLLGRQTLGTGTYENIIGLPPQEGAQVFRYVAGLPIPVQPPAYTVYTFSGGAWSPSAPTLNIGEAAFFVVPCPEKWEQAPDLSTNGFDVLATQPMILADDFLCTATGPITEIRIRGSWLNDNIATQACFCLGIWSDVPRAGTNYSRPGQQLCNWCFSPGKYTYSVYTNGVNELFYDPSLPGIIGSDTVIREYVFHVPFNQTCIQTNGNVYWVSATLDCVTTNLFGWKTCPTNWNDDAVFGHVAGTNTPLMDWQELRRPGTTNSLDLSFTVLTATTGQPVTNYIPEKWLQPPDISTNGLDVRASRPKILADDFLCTATGPITQVRVWGSWRFDEVPPPPFFHIGIWSDAPAQGTNYSHPDQLLCSYDFSPGQYICCPYTNGVNEQFFDPNIPAIIGTDTYICEYDFNLTNACWQTNGNVYWLSVWADGFDTNQFFFGWKTTPYNWNDDAVYGHVDTNGAPLMDWKELRRPPLYSNSLDLAFEIITTPTNKWLQIPDTSYNGLDVKATDPKILADDFRCTATGPISEIHVWGSWLNDALPPTPPSFCLGIWTDIPQQGTNHSRPGQLICEWCFVTNQYVSFPLTNYVYEQFYDPNTSNIIGNDTTIWEYIFDARTNLNCIQTNGNTYWLSLVAVDFDTTNFVFGWKTCPTNWNDDAVFGHVFSTNHVPLNDWVELRRPPIFSNSLDLAFEIITDPTNPPSSCAPLNVVCPPDKTVECGSNWTVDVPIVLTNVCCETNHTLAYTAVTNGVCPKIITFNWVITDQLGRMTHCAQHVTLQDITPPTIICPSNIVVLNCNTSVFWSITATDACGSVTVTSSPPSGTFFNCGTTNTVTAIATDACGNSNSCTFLVIVRRPVVSVAIGSAPGTIKITWTDACTLQEASDIRGPWTDLPLATSPYTVTASASQKFYRLRCP